MRDRRFAEHRVSLQKSGAAGRLRKAHLGLRMRRRRCVGLGRMMHQQCGVAAYDDKVGEDDDRVTGRFHFPAPLGVSGSGEATLRSAVWELPIRRSFSRAETSLRKVALNHELPPFPKSPRAPPVAAGAIRGYRQRVCPGPPASFARADVGISRSPRLIPISLNIEEWVKQKHPSGLVPLMHQPPLYGCEATFHIETLSFAEMYTEYCLYSDNLASRYCLGPLSVVTLYTDKTIASTSLRL